MIEVRFASFKRVEFGVAGQILLNREIRFLTSAFVSCAQIGTSDIGASNTAASFCIEANILYAVLR